jgi:DNA-binding transcriptional MerR regulator
LSSSSWPKPSVYKIGDVARLLGTSVSTLRYYENEGLLTPVRTSGGTRLYNDAEVARFRIALKLTALGIPLQELVEVTRARPGQPTGGHSSRRVLRRLAKIRETILRQRDDLNEVLRSIERGAELVATCLDCTLEPTNAGCPDCPCSTHFEDSSMLALTWSVRE